MELNEFEQILKLQGINLEHFKLVYIIPSIDLDKGKPETDCFELKFEKIEEEE